MDNDDKSREEMFDCACHTHKMEVFTCDMVGGHYDFTLTAWQQGYGCIKWSLWERVKILFRFLFTGQWPYDWITLEPDEARRLGQYLLDECKRMEQ